MMERKRRVFPEGFKREAMERVRSSGVPIVRVAHENGGAKVGHSSGGMTLLPRRKSGGPTPISRTSSGRQGRDAPSRVS
jgi:transposase-like protein